MINWLKKIFGKKQTTENQVVAVEPEKTDSSEDVRISTKHNDKLRERLDELTRSVVKDLTNTTLDAFERHEESLKQDHIVDKGLKIGDKVEDFELPNHEGTVLKLSEMLKDGTVVLTFYRGGWCPWCNLQLRYMQQSLPDFKTLGAKLVAVSPESPENSKNTHKEKELGYEVLSDLKSEISRKMNVGYRVPEYLLSTYKSMGFDLKDHNKTEDVYLPIPATYVIDSDFTVKYAWSSEDFKERADVGEILKAIITINREKRAKRAN